MVGVAAALGVPVGAQNSPPPDTPDAGHLASASCVAPGPHGFTDVLAGSSYDIPVRWLVESGITTGTSPGKFSPTSRVTRAQMAVVLWRAAGSPAPAGAHGFTDVPASGSSGDAVSWLIEAGVTTGTSPGRYSPASPVTRAQMAVFLWRGEGSPPPIGTHGFSDVVANSFYETALTWLAEQQITSGTSPGKFSPTSPVSRAQMAVFLWRSACPPPTPGSPIVGGGEHSCALKQDVGTVSCWGENFQGELGDGTTTGRLTPTPVLGLTGATAIATAWAHSCALEGDGTVSCWGNNFVGELGDGTGIDRLTPTPVSGLTGVTAISTGGDHSCALKQDRTVSCWGWNGDGQLGDGTDDPRSTPTLVVGLTGVTAISAGPFQSCALKRNGTVVCWGANGHGELGDGTTDDRLTPTPVSGLTGANAIATDYAHSCALKGNGTATCWGYNDFGQLGDGTTTNRLTPTPVLGLTSATAINAGDYHSCALKANGTVTCWGDNSNGQLGDSTTDQRLTPTLVTGLTSATAITAAYAHSCALKDDGTVACWGYNHYGQLGDGTTEQRSTPTPVSGF